MNFIEKRISTKRAITILAQNGIQIDNSEAAVILNFLYLIAKAYQWDSNTSVVIPKERSNYKKVR
jgi:hypothetical protein